MDKNSCLIQLAESDRTDFGRVDFLLQPHDQRVFSAIWALESEVNSGGFSHLLLLGGRLCQFRARRPRMHRGACGCWNCPKSH